MRQVLLALLVVVGAAFSSGSGVADQIDVILKFASLAAAKADPVVQQHRNAIADAFADDRVIPNLKVWRVSQNVNGVPQPLTGWYMLVSLESEKVPDALRNHLAVQIAINRDKMNSRLAGMVIRSTVGPAIGQDLRWEPVFAGSDPPWGAWQ